MLRIFGALCALVFVGGCGSVALKESTLAVGSSLTDLHYRMVLDNLAMFRSDGNSLPWHLKITTGLVQINDTVGGAYTVATPLARALAVVPSQGWTESWTVVPEVDHHKLRNLMTIYQHAAHSADYPRFFADGDQPGGKPFGHHGDKYVWVKQGQLAALTALTLKVLGGAPLQSGERPFTVPGVQINPR
jgi:hypothetical protein